MADPNSLFDPQTPIADQIPSNPVGTSMLWGVDPTTLRPYANAGVTPGLNADSILKLPMANVAMGFGDSPATMAGIGAKTANIPALKAAIRMAERGTDSDAIWKNTGWMQGADGQWRFEIPDNAAQIGGKDYAGGQLTLGHVLDHPELFKAYPDLAEMPVHAMPKDLAAQGYRGAFDPQSGGMWITGGRSPSETLSTILHENQHAVQTREGFQNGGNLNEETIRATDNLPILRDQVQGMDGQMRAAGLDPQLIKQALSMGDGAAAEAMSQMARLGGDFATNYRDSLSRLGSANQAAEYYRNNYSNMAGEVEARNTQSRQNLTPEQRRQMPPDWTQDVPTEQQIVVQGNNGVSYQLKPVQGVPEGVGSGFSLAKQELPKSYVEAHGLGENDHLFDIKRPDGRSIGTVHLQYDPATGAGRIASSYVGGGPQTLGTRGIMDLKAQLRAAFPEMTSLNGERVSGANPNREVSVGMK